MKKVTGAIKIDNMQFTFGKFKGKTVEYVFNHQPSYLAWAVSQNLIELDKITEKKLIRIMEFENLEHEAMMEFKHGDWGNRDDGL